MKLDLEISAGTVERSLAGWAARLAPKRRHLGLCLQLHWQVSLCRSKPNGDRVNAASRHHELHEDGIWPD
ncbi:hypothetical protein VTK56DRAFT_10032 [Thermocarpiscus australiensis]